jgi:hypothetical protein
MNKKFGMNFVPNFMFTLYNIGGFLPALIPAAIAVVKHWD